MKKKLPEYTTVRVRKDTIPNLLFLAGYLSMTQGAPKATDAAVDFAAKIAREQVEASQKTQAQS